MVNKTEICEGSPVGYAIKNPIDASSIGIPKPDSDSTNISSVAARFTINSTLSRQSADPDNQRDDYGSQAGAFRHVYWQALITKEIGAEDAKNAGNAHEANYCPDLSIRKFKSIREADQTADLLNNEIGRALGAKHPNASRKQLAQIALDEYKKEGFYTIKKIGDEYVVEKTKLSPEDHKKASTHFSDADNNGFPSRSKYHNKETASNTTFENTPNASTPATQMTKAELAQNIWAEILANPPTTQKQQATTRTA
jgi:hypothetical protein